MPKPRVYIETTIPSFYHEARTTPDIVARRDWTRDWWTRAPACYELVTSPAVLDELSAGDSERGAERLALISGLPILPVEPAIVDIVQTYIQHKVMPANPAGDALHLALASYHKCDSCSRGTVSILQTRTSLGTFVASIRYWVFTYPHWSHRWNCKEIVMKQTDVDPVIDEIREARRRISARVDHSPARLVDYYIRLQEQYRERLVPSPKPTTRRRKPAA